MTTTNDKNIATVLHLSTLTQYFIPFGNYIFPIVIWSSKKNDSEFVDVNGKQVLNFQLSMFLYTLLLLIISIPLLIYGFVKDWSAYPFLNQSFDSSNFNFEIFSNEKISGLIIMALITGLLLVLLKITEFILVIHAAVKASNGEEYKYPLSIPFFK